MVNAGGFGVCAMKSFPRISLCALLLASIASAGCATAQPVPSDQGTVATSGPEVDVDAFQPVLAPYGQWITVPGYGLVWQPSPAVVGVDFVPYTDGHWVYTDAGWLWVSDYSWGWAPFHYGTWVYLDTGWGWVPGSVWGPAWVEWRYGGGYIGWAPLVPVGYVAFAPARYTYVQVDHFNSIHVRSEIVIGTSARVIAARTEALPSARVVNGHAVVPVGVGPRPEVISRAVGHPVTAVPVHSVAARVAPPASMHGVHYVSGSTAQRPFAQQPHTSTVSNGSASHAVEVRPASQSALHTEPHSGTVEQRPMESAAPQRAAESQALAPRASPRYQKPRVTHQASHEAPHGGGGEGHR
jgi:hypothetical protein